jgi:hypothetical protein
LGDVEITGRCRVTVRGFEDLLQMRPCTDQPLAESLHHENVRATCQNIDQCPDPSKGRKE